MSTTAPTDYPVNPMIAGRWSPYGYADRPVSDDDLRSLFEAARWAPSCFNEQPWRYLVARREKRLIALAAELRLVPAGISLPLILLSSLGPREAGDEEGDFAAFLLKPIKASQLYNVLVGILETVPVTDRETMLPAESEFDPGMGKRMPLRILLAEDNVVNQKVALRLLERLGYRADVAANGEEATRTWIQG